MPTKYIVNNLQNQTISGNLTIDGSLSVSGVSTTSMSSYKANLTQTGSITGTDISTFGYQLIIGETYTIDNYVAPDDFSNVANVVSGVINQTGCQFIATGTTPSVWGDGSQLTSGGGLIVDVIENNLGYDISWLWAPFGGSGYYVGVNNLIGPQPNTFPRNKTQIFTQTVYSFSNYEYYQLLSNVSSFMDYNNIVTINAYDFDILDLSNNLLYFTPVQINVQQDMTPIVISGTVDSSYPIDNVSVRTYCDGSTVETYYGNTDNANNISELILALNSDTTTNVLGTYSSTSDGGVLLTMTTHNASFFCPTGTLTFEVFAD